MALDDLSTTQFFFLTLFSICAAYLALMLVNAKGARDADKRRR
jgi:hypothetical protein